MTQTVTAMNRGGGTAAVAIGFATKNLVSSFVAGLIIMLDRPFLVGDRIPFAGEYGDVMVIGMRSVKLRTLGESVVTSGLARARRDPRPVAAAWIARRP